MHRVARSLYSRLNQRLILYILVDGGSLSHLLHWVQASHNREVLNRNKFLAESSGEILLRFWKEYTYQQRIIDFTSYPKRFRHEFSNCRIDAWSSTIAIVFILYFTVGDTEVFSGSLLQLSFLDNGRNISKLEPTLVSVVTRITPWCKHTICNDRLNPSPVPLPFCVSPLRICWYLEVCQFIVPYGTKRDDKSSFRIPMPVSLTLIWIHFPAERNWSRESPDPSYSTREVRESDNGEIFLTNWSGCMPISEDE